MEPKVFACKEDGCDQKVIYVPDPIPGTLGLTETPVRSSEEVVYLTCPKGHLHSYKVSEEW